MLDSLSNSREAGLPEFTALKVLHILTKYSCALQVESVIFNSGQRANMLEVVLGHTGLHQNRCGLKIKLRFLLLPVNNDTHLDFTNNNRRWQHEEHLVLNEASRLLDWEGVLTMLVGTLVNSPINIVVRVDVLVRGVSFLQLHLSTKFSKDNLRVFTTALFIFI